MLGIYSCRLSARVWRCATHLSSAEEATRSFRGNLSWYPKEPNLQPPLLQSSVSAKGHLCARGLTISDSGRAREVGSTTHGALGCNTSWCFRRPGAGETVAFQLFTKLQSNSNPPKEILADIKVHIQLTDKEKTFFDPGVFLNTRAEFALSYLRC